MENRIYNKLQNILLEHLKSTNDVNNQEVIMTIIERAERLNRETKEEKDKLSFTWLLLIAGLVILFVSFFYSQYLFCKIGIFLIMLALGYWGFRP